jgi:hypothetical protein
MLSKETVAVYCENHREHTDTVRTSQETIYFSATEPNRLMLFEETVAVNCENRTEHTDTVRTSQETHYVYNKSSSAVWCMNSGLVTRAEPPSIDLHLDNSESSIRAHGEYRLQLRASLFQCGEILIFPFN